MKNKIKLSLITSLTIVNFSLLGVILWILCLSQNKDTYFQTLQVTKLMVKDPNSKGYILLEGGNTAKITLYNELDNPSLELAGGLTPSLALKNKWKNTVGTWTVLPDNCPVFALANEKGMAASIIKGGENPAATFYKKNSDPLVSLGLVFDEPHLLLSGKNGQEGVLLHGGDTNGMVIMDERGQVKVYISKKGFMQDQNETKSQPDTEKNQKLFTYEDIKKLFPGGMLGQ